ncbi:unnamed protein product [Scytosiphon promiscuus]
MAADERLPLVKRRLADKRAEAGHDQPTFRGAAKMLVCCVLLFAAAATSARMFPHGDRGRPSSRGVELSEGPLKVTAVALESEEDGSTLAPVHVTTEECTGNTEKPVAMGADFVAYRSLSPGAPAVRGSEDFSATLGRYVFYFSTPENKMEFESDPVRYLPAWGGFCSYGISHEIVWNQDNLGPSSNPDYWLIVDDQLYLFRSATPFAKFQTSMDLNIAHGNFMWTEWFDGSADPTTTPFNTACFCTEDTCEDG